MNLESQSMMEMAQKLLRQASEEEKKGLCMAICDRAGYLIMFLRTENASARGISIAIDKAYTAAMMECSTLSLHERLEREKLSLADFCNSRYTAMPGGAPIKDGDLTLGGVGFSGCKPERDQIVAERVAASLVTLALQ